MGAKPGLEAKSEKLIISGILAISSLLTWAFIVRKGLGSIEFGDATDYLRSAESIYTNEGYLREGLTLPFFRPPGYPGIIAMFWTIFGFGNIWVLKIFNIALQCLGGYLIFKIVRKRHPLITGIISMLFFFFNPFLFLPLGDIQTEPLVTVLFLVIIYLLTLKPKTSTNIILGIIVVLITAARPEYLFVVFPVLVLKAVRHRKSSEVLVQSMTIFLILFMSLSWWAAQNKKATGEYIFLTNATSYQLWVSSGDLIDRNYKISTKYDPGFDLRIYKEYMAEIQRLESSWGNEYQDARISEKSSYWWNAYLDKVQESEVAYVKSVLKKGVIFWRPFLNPSSHGAKLAFLSFLVLFPIYVTTVIGSIRMRKDPLFRIVVDSYLLGLVFLTLVHMLQWPDQRYKFPVLIPLTSIVVIPYFYDKFQPKLFALVKHFPKVIRNK